MSKTLPREVHVLLCDPLEGRLARQVALAEARAEARRALDYATIERAGAAMATATEHPAAATLPMLVDPMKFTRPPRMNRAQRRAAKRAKGARRR